MWAGLAVLRDADGRARVTAFVLLAVFCQIARNWLVLWALGVDASIFDATAVLIAMVVLSQLPIGPSVGAAAVVMILGAGGVALTAAAGVLLTATGSPARSASRCGSASTCSPGRASARGGARCGLRPLPPPG